MDGSQRSRAARARFDASGGRALVVERGGRVVAEAYGPGVDAGTRLNSYSMVKTLVGLLALHAVAEGRIPSTAMRLPALVPGAPDVTIRELLDMTAGLALFDEPPKIGTSPMDDGAFGPLSPVARMHVAGATTVLAEMEVDPEVRGRFAYQSAATALLGLAVATAWERPLEAILSEVIWRPAGAGDAAWRVGGDGRVSAYCCLYATTRDWTRVGRLLLGNGTPELPLLPDAVWRDWILPDLPPEARRRSAYRGHLRHDVLDRAGAGIAGPFAYAMGHRGQVLYLLPGADAVVVRFGDAPQLLHSTLYEVLGP